MALDLVTVEQYTQGRLDRDDPETARLLASALSAARRWCGWHVAPLISNDEVTVDGPGGKLLVLPTLRLTDLVTVIEDGTNIDLDGLHWSARGLVRKDYGSWSQRFGSITVVMSHGFDDAEDFDSAVLSYIERSSQSAGSLVSVGPFRWSEQKATSVFSDEERGLLEQYRLESPA